MTFELPVKLIDYLLYNYLDLRKEVELLGTSGSGIITIPRRGVRRRSRVETIAIERAEITMVLDAVERGWKRLTPELRRVAVAKYRWRWLNKEIEDRRFLAERTVTTRLSATRAVIAGHLALVPVGIFADFWRKIRVIFEEIT